MHKILVVLASGPERDELEQILQEIVESGGELIFTDTTEEGLNLLKQERPQLVLLDAQLIGDRYERWIDENVRIILVGSKEQASQSKDFLLKPFKADQVLQKCHESLGQKAASQMPPM